MSYESAYKSAWFYDKRGRKERRGEHRRRLEGRIPGRFITATGQTIDCLDVNVSASGLGVTSKAKILPGTNLLWIIDNQVFKFRMLWSVMDEKRADFHKYGFRSLDESVDIEGVISAWLDKEEEAPQMALC